MIFKKATLKQAPK